MTNERNGPDEAAARQRLQEWQTRQETLRKTAQRIRHQFGTSALVRVGDGRGLVIAPRDRPRLVITVAHCLPEQPPAIAIAGDNERSYRAPVGPPDETPQAAALCVFVDAISDIAVLNSTGFDETFLNLVNSVNPLALARPASEPQPAQLIALDGTWFSRALEKYFVSDPARPIEGGMSGSPILDARGRAIGASPPVVTPSSRAAWASSYSVRSFGPVGWLLHSCRWQLRLCR
jgi:hypothetical protein